MAQVAEYLTPDFRSGHNLTVREIVPHVGVHAERGACLRFPPSLSLSKIKKKKISSPLDSRIPLVSPLPLHAHF